jgi:hypothetical protein
MSRSEIESSRNQKRLCDNAAAGVRQVRKESTPPEIGLILPFNKLKGESVSPAPTVKSGSRGRPIVHTEPWAKITVVLLDRHVAYLDRLAIDIRLKHGRAISRAEIIRGLIEAAFQSGVDLSQADSIDTIVELLTSSKRKGR